MKSLLRAAGRHFAALAICAVAFLAIEGDAFAQGAVQQSGSVTPGHGFLWITNGIAADSGAANGGGTGVGLSELNITQRSTTPSGPLSTPFCINDAPITSSTGYHQLCFGPAATTGGGVLSYNAYGTASQLPFSFNINGSTFSLPTGGYGSVNGPVSSTVGDIAVWNNTAGTLLADLSILTVPHGGTGAASFTASLPLIGAGTAAIAQGTVLGNTTKFTTASGSFVAGHCLQLDSSLNIVDATFPCSSGSGSGTVSSGTINDLAFYPATGTTVTGLATANSGVLVTSVSGVPSISTTLPSGIAATNMALTTPAIGAATGTSLVLSSTASATQYTSTIVTGTAPFVVASTTPVANLAAATAGTATTAANATNITTTDDNSTNASYFPTFQTATGGTNPLKTASTKLTFNPSTGTLTTQNVAAQVNGNTITTGTGTITLASGKTLTISNTMTFAGTDSSTYTFPGASDTIAGIGTNQSWTASQRSASVNVAISTATYTPNFNLRNNFDITLVHAACPCTMANPTNIVAGQSGVIQITQSATGSDTITTWGSDWKFPGGTKPTLSTGASAVDLVSYYVFDATHINATFAGGNFQ